MKTAIIILNWNGCDLLTSCLQSLMQVRGEYFVVVADNASSDDSINRAASWIQSKGIEYRIVEEGCENNILVNNHEVVLYSLKCNYGFAKGNNMAVALAMQSSPERILLLNNDTEVEPCFLSQLENFSEQHPEYKALTPLIHLFYDKNRIWNAGGRLFAGFRKYFYANRKREEIKETGHIDISFVTGCALYFTPDLLDEDKKIFTERFFFGEEDFEFSLRMKKAKVKMACVLDSVIYHKVGSSISNKAVAGKLYIHYLNRFIDIRIHYGKIFYNVWSCFYKPLIRRTLRKQECPNWLIENFITRLYKNAECKNQVTATDFKKSLEGGWSGVTGRPLRLFMLADTSSDHTKRWVSATATRGVEIFLFSFNNRDASFYEHLPNVIYHTFGIFSTLKDQRRNGAFEKLRYLKTLSVLKRCIKEFNPDMIHAHYASSYALLGALSGFHPFVVSMWGSDIYFFPKVSLLHKAVLKYNFRKADRLLSTSECMANEASNYTKKDINVTPFGVDTDLFRPIVGNKPDDEFVIATVKTLATVYGIDTLIEAFAIVKQQMPSMKLRLIIAGEGKEKANLKNLSMKLGVADYVDFLGKIPNSDVPQLYANVDVYVSLSRKESFGVAAIEAMACEVPVVVSDADGFKEVVRDATCGFIVPMNDAAKAAEKIMFLLQNRDFAKEMGVTAREFVVKNYSWTASVDKMMSIYKEMI